MTSAGFEQDARRSDHPAEILSARYRQIDAGWVDAKLKQRLKFQRSGNEAPVILNGSDADPLGLHASILNRFLVSRLLRMEAVDYVYGKIKEIQPSAPGRYRVLFEDLSSDVFDEVVIRHGADSALQAGFPALAKKCAPLRAKNELDQTRTPIWPSGWFRDRWSTPVAGAGTHAKEEPETALSESREAPAGLFKQNLSSVMPLSPAKVEPPGVIYSVDNSVFHVPYAPKGNHMVGRAGLLERVHTQLRQLKRTHIGQAASFQGIGGLGKTQTAVEYAHRYRDEYPGGVVWLFADQDIDAQLTQLAVAARWVAEQSEHSIKLDIATQRLQTHPNCLLIFDNLEDVKRIEPYLPAPSLGVHILVTSRLEQLGFEPIPIDPLFPEEALSLLLLEADRPETKGSELLAAKSIVEQLDGLPLALELELAGAYLRHRPAIAWQEYLELLRDEGLRKALPGKFLVSGTRHEADLFVTLRLSEQLLQEEPRLKEILAVMAELAPPSLGTALLATLLGEEKPIRLADALSLGVKLRILRLEEGETGQRRYRMHRLVWVVLREKRPLDGVQRREVGKRLVNWLMALRDDPAKLGSYEAELAHLHEWEKTALDNGWNDEQVRCQWLQGYPPYHRGQYRQASHPVRKTPVMKASKNRNLRSVS